MKQGWTYKKVGDVFKTYSGGTPIKSHKEYYENGDIPWIRSGEVCRKYITESEMFITQAGLENSSAKFFPIDTILVAMYGATAAQVGILKIKATSNQAVCGILPHENFIPEFVYYWFKLIESDLASQAQGGAQPNISQEKIKKVDFPIISLAEQERIVERLDAAFAQIDELKSNAEKQLAEARALFQSALTQAMQPKPGWQEKKLKEICRVINGRAYAKHEMLNEGKYRLLRVGNFFTNNQWFYSDLELEEDKYCDYGDLLYAWSASFGPRIWDGEKVIYHYHIWKMICSDEIDKLFLFYWLDSDMLKSQTMTNLHGTTMAHITKNIIENSIVVFPSMPNQKQIASNLDSISRRVKELEEISRKTAADCDALKQALLRQIFE